MNEVYSTLSDMILTLVGNTRAHICIHDVSGILQYSLLNIDYKNHIHSKAFCTAAKSSSQGYRMCITCKMHANEKAISGKTLFYGHCPYGLLEIVKPVVIEEKVQCIVYVGNLVKDRAETEEKIHRTCKITKAPEEMLKEYLEEAQPIQSPEYYIRFANLIDSYIRLLFDQSKGNRQEPKQEYHWAVAMLADYIKANYHQELSLQKIAKLYYISDKYVGRLFKSQMGQTFHEYLSKVRLEHAGDRLLGTTHTVLDIALAGGFQNVTYFNRVFLKQHGLTPSQYRKRHISSAQE